MHDHFGTAVVIATSLTVHLFCAAAWCEESPRIRTLIITGQNNHNWQYTSRVHRDTLEATGRFAVDLTDDPHRALLRAEQIAEYDLFVLDYNDFNQPNRWGDAAERNFVSAVRNGAGVVAIHSANNAFAGWIEYEQMLGLMWREGAGHGRFHQFDVTFTQKNHPITRGLPPMSNHPDELYHGLSNPQNVAFEVLATASSSVESGGSGRDEPVAITLQYGSGRVFATALGHVWTNVPQTKAAIEDPAFKILFCRAAEWAATGSVTLGTEWSDVREPNHLSDDERQQGWQLLFDGSSTDHWRGFRQDSFPQAAWQVRDGVLCTVVEAEGKDLITREQFGDFEFTCQWRIKSGGNSGIMYRASEDHPQSWHSGPEMQILDDAAHPNADGRNRAGALYDLYPSEHDMVRPAGQWNTATIVLRGSTVEHWLNGVRIVSCDLESEEFAKRRDASKFATMPDFARLRRGHIALQHHGNQVCYRNIMVRRLD